MIDKKHMTEEDIKLQYITPAITSKWNVRKVTMETQITDGRINLRGNFAFREKRPLQIKIDNMYSLHRLLHVKVLNMFDISMQDIFE